MNGNALLESAANTYKDLKSFAIEGVVTSESGDEFSFNRNQELIRAFFLAPDKIRIEQGGRRGTVIVSNGVDLHYYFGAARRHSKRAVQDDEFLPGWFRPDYPVSGTATFLFARIAERITRAEFLRDEPIADDASGAICHVVSAVYEPIYPGLIEFVSPVTFWVHSYSRSSCGWKVKPRTAFRPTTRSTQANTFLRSRARSLMNT